MATTLKTTDLRLPSQRVNLTAPDADDILMIEDISEGAGNKLKYITKAQMQADFGIDDNTTHRSSDGSDHTFIDQNVTSGSSPTFDGDNFTGVDADDVDIADAGNRYTGTDVETALQEIAGAGRTTETVKDNFNNHADHLAAEKPHGVFEGDTKTHTYGLKVADGHLIIEFEEVV